MAAYLLVSQGLICLETMHTLFGMIRWEASNLTGNIIKSKLRKQYFKICRRKYWRRASKILIVVNESCAYVFFVWDKHNETRHFKLRMLQNTALCIATCCTLDTNIQHMHDETVTPTPHLKMHHKSDKNYPLPPTKHSTHRQKKQTAFNNYKYTQKTHQYKHQHLQSTHQKHH